MREVDGVWRLGDEFLHVPQHDHTIAADRKKTAFRFVERQRDDALPKVDGKRQWRHAAKGEVGDSSIDSA